MAVEAQKREETRGVAPPLVVWEEIQMNDVKEIFDLLRQHPIATVAAVVYFGGIGALIGCMVVINYFTIRGITHR